MGNYFDKALGLLLYLFLHGGGLFLKLDGHQGAHSLQIFFYLVLAGFSIAVLRITAVSILPICALDKTRYEFIQMLLTRSTRSGMSRFNCF